MSGNSQNDQRSNPKYAARVPESIRTPDVVESARLGRLEFFDGMPSDETVRKVYDQLDFARGVETFLTGCPAASIYAFVQGMEELARHGAWERVLRHSAALRADRAGAHEDLETRRLCEDELKLNADGTLVQNRPRVLKRTGYRLFRAEVGLHIFVSMHRQNLTSTGAGSTTFPFACRTHPASK
jgi:hypothetical protein